MEGEGVMMGIAKNLYFIKDVDEKKKRVYLENFIEDKKRIYICTSDEAKFYREAFLNALYSSFYLSVEYDENCGVIIQN